MKRMYLSLAALLCLCIALAAKERVIERPPFLVSSTNSIEVSRIVLSDTATVLHIYANNRPGYWIKIASGSFLQDNNGETYPLLKGIGITPDKEFWMPQSGEAEFQLVFPPLPAHTATINFSEGADIANGYNIWGLRLDGKELPPLDLPKEAITHTVNPEANLPQPVLQYGTGILKGRFLDYHPGMARSFYLALSDVLYRTHEPYQVPIKEDGSFQIELELTGTTCIYFYPEGVNQTMQCFVQPGQTTEMYINLRELCRQSSKYHWKDKPFGLPAYINGPMAGIAQELNQYADAIDHLTSYSYWEHWQELSSMNPQTFKTYIAENYARIRQNIEKLPLSLATRQLLTLQKDLSQIYLLNWAANTLAQARQTTQQLSDEEMKNVFKELQAQVPADYIDDSLLQRVDTPQVLLTSNCTELFQGMLYRPMEYLQHEGKDKTLATVLKAVRLSKALQDYATFDEAQQDELAALPEAFRQILNKDNARLQARLEANKLKTGYRIHEVPDATNEKLFEAILAQFSGKVLLVDFWATWCGPCRMANKAMRPMKEELKDQDIVYVYITGETSPLATWKNMIPDIHGEHFRLTNEQWAYLYTQLQIGGVPTYFVVDRTGKVDYKQTGFPGAETIKSKLLEAIAR